MSGGKLTSSASCPEIKPKKDGAAQGRVSKVSASALKLLAAVDSDVKVADKHLCNGEPREAVVCLQRAYRKADTADAKTNVEAVGLARAVIHLKLAAVHIALQRYRDAAEEAAYSVLSADAAWQTMLSALPTSTENPAEPQDPAAALRVLLEDPPPWLEKAADLSVRARCQAASALYAAATSKAGENLASEQKENAIKEANSLVQEAHVLAMHFLIEDHPVQLVIEKVLQQLKSAPDDGSNVELEKPMFDESSPLSGMSESELQSFKAAQASQLPPLLGLHCHKRLPPSRQGTASAPASAQASVTFQDSFQDQEPDAWTPPLSGLLSTGSLGSLSLRSTAPAAWTGHCPRGDVYYSTLPKQKLPRLSSTGRRSKKGVQAEPTAAQLKRAEGVAGGRPMVQQEEPPPPNAFQDWLSSFDDPARHDIKRIMMRSEEASKRLTGDLKHQSQYFRARVLGEASDWDLYLNRIHFSAYGMKAAKAAEKRYGIGFKTQEADSVLQKKKTRHDLFNYFRVDTGKGEPSLKTLGKLLRESEPGRDRAPKTKLTKSEQAAKDMQSMFSGGLGVKRKDDVDPDIGSLLGGSLGSSRRSVSRERSKSPKRS